MNMRTLILKIWLTSWRVGNIGWVARAHKKSLTAINFKRRRNDTYAYISELGIKKGIYFAEVYDKDFVESENEFGRLCAFILLKPWAFDIK
ncbi:hypothetical protein HZS_3959 [Henneguya salminicola]|nr:hypothetical protein HZS_3959 [Henneguya salminicola]